MLIDVKQAVRVALEYVQEIFEGEKLSDLGLEEVERVDGTWLVTVGFSRPWDYPKPERRSSYGQSLWTELRPFPDMRPDRDYKVVSVNAETGGVESVKNREQTTNA